MSDAEVLQAIQDDDEERLIGLLGGSQEEFHYDRLLQPRPAAEGSSDNSGDVSGGERSLLEAAFALGPDTRVLRFLLTSCGAFQFGCLAAEVERENVALLEALARSAVKLPPGALGPAVRHAAANKDAAFLMQRLKPALGSAWPDCLTDQDARGRCCLHWAATAGRLDELEFLLSEFRRLKLCTDLADADGVTFAGRLAERHPHRALEAANRCPLLLRSLRPEYIDPATMPQTADMSKAAAEAAVSELLPGSARPLLRAVRSGAAAAEDARRRLAEAAASTGSVDLVRALLRLRLLSPETLEAATPQPAELAASGHLELARELLLMRRRDLLESSLELHRSCDRQLTESAASTPTPSDGLRRLQEFAERVCLNTVELVYAACPPACERLVHAHLMRRPGAVTNGGGCTGLTRAASIADRALRLRSVFATRCFVDLVDRRWRIGDSYRRVSGGGHGCQRASFQAPPRVKFVLHTCAFLLFMALHALYILTVDDSWRWLDTVLAVYLVSYGLQELHELLRTRQSYFTIWNAVDQLQLLFLLIGQALKAAVATGSAAQEQLYNGRLLLGVSFMLCGLKFVSQLRAHHKFGPFINMMKALFWADLVPFLVAVFFFLTLCSGIFFHALLTPGNQLYRASGEPIVSDNQTLYWDIYLRPLLLAFGEFRYDSLAGCLDGDDAQVCPHPTGLRYYARGLMHVYLIIVNLLLINLLIARFSLTVAVKDEQSFLIWRRYRYQVLLEYERINALPPPLNAPNIAADWLLRCIGAGRRAASSDATELRAVVNANDDEAAADGDESDAGNLEADDAAAAMYELVQAVALRGRRGQLAGCEPAGEAAGGSVGLRDAD